MPEDASVNIGARDLATPCGPRSRVSGMQTKLHHWAAADPGFKEIMLEGLPVFVREGQYPFPVAMAGAIVLPAAVAAVLGLAIMRLAGIALSIATFAFLMHCNALSRSSTSIERSGTGVPEPPSDAMLTCRFIFWQEP